MNRLDLQAPKTLPSAELEGVRVLIVADNELNRRILTEETKNWGLRSEGLETGSQALSALRAALKGDPYQIAILDYQMPGMGGETLGRTIKDDPVLKDTQLIMLTSMGQRGDAKRFKAIGFSAYLTKPVRSSQLKETLTARLITPTLISRPLRTSVFGLGRSWCLFSFTTKQAEF